MNRKTLGNTKLVLGIVMVVAFLFASLGISQGSVFAQGIAVDEPILTQAPLTESVPTQSPNLSTTVPTLSAPSGTTYDTTPSYKWTLISGATKYSYTLLNGSTTIYTVSVASGSCGSSATYCVNTPTKVLALGAYTWKVRAYVKGAWKSYSAAKSFSIATTAFDSEFTSNASGWLGVHGTWGYGGGYLQGVDDDGYFASAIHINSFGTMTYEVKMKRTGYAYAPQGIYFCGSPSPIVDGALWNNGYMFLYSNSGEFEILEMYQGTLYVVVSWSDTSYLTSSTNTLKVTHSKSNGYTKFYINGHYLGYIYLDDFSSGMVGVTYFDDGYSNDKLYVDYAKVSLSAPSSMVAADGESGTNLSSGRTPASLTSVEKSQ